MKPVTERTRLKALVDIAIANFGSDSVELKLLEAIERALLFDEELATDIKQLGFKCAIELYDCGSQNVPHEIAKNDPNNPRNWPGYSEFAAEGAANYFRESRDYISDYRHW